MSQYSYGGKAYAPSPPGDFKWAYAVTFTGTCERNKKGDKAKGGISSVLLFV
jgi:hypothetical protein